MNKQEHAVDLIFKTFSKDELEKIKKESIEIYLKSVGLEEYIDKFPYMESYTYEIIKDVLEHIKIEHEEKEIKDLFYQYTNEDNSDLMNKDNFRLLVNNHFDCFNEEQVETMVNDSFGEKNNISYDEFKKIIFF